MRALATEAEADDEADDEKRDSDGPAEVLLDLA